MLHAGMRFSLFYEHQLPRPWSEDSERSLLEDALEQIVVAERAGFDRIWEVEHHFLEEYSHSSAPEVFLAAASQRTERIRLGHGIVQLPPGVNHPARVAERVATLDLVSGGRVDFGTGEGSSAGELGGFLIDRTQKHAQWEDALDAITRMFVEEPFAGWESDFFRMPPRNVVPKPVQRPHPPLWVACSRRETIHVAARKGIGALAFSFVEPEDAGKWVREYYELIASEECVPAGFAVNPNVAVVLPMMCHPDEAEAIERGINGAHFFGYSLAHYYGGTPHAIATTDVYREFLDRREATGFARDIVTPDQAPLGVRLLQEGLGSLRGAIGTPEQITDLLRRYEAVGVDEVGMVLQAGRNAHEHICESLEIFGQEVIPRFAEDRERADREKAERLAPAIEAALGRREPPREQPGAYVIDEPAELERARRVRRRAALAPRDVAGRLRDELRQGVRRRAQRALARFVDGASDTEIERRFGSQAAQRALLVGMARSFEPEMAFGFEGEIEYELSRRSDGDGAAPARSDRWTIRIGGDKARVLPGPGTEPAVTVRMGLVDFVRIAAGGSPMPAFLEGRVELEGDLSVARRMTEMFGGPSPY
jgi:alkanesulfonate monooxygenase SsuD/methylene tetrahydromethanopterin reductase-like flavin-dependent oxidoreductase (luciferase family)